MNSGPPRTCTTPGMPAPCMIKKLGEAAGEYAPYYDAVQNQYFFLFSV
jgi:hypothetical protein